MNLVRIEERIPLWMDLVVLAWVGILAGLWYRRTDDRALIGLAAGLIMGLRVPRLMLRCFARKTDPDWSAPYDLP